MESLAHLLRKGSIWTTAKTLVEGLIGVFVTVFIVRSLSVYDYGVYNVLFAILSYAGIISSFGIVSVFQRFLPELHSNNNITIIKKLIFRGSVLRLIISILFVLLLFLFTDFIEDLLNVDGWAKYFSIFSVGIILYVEMGLFSSVLTSLFLHKYLAISNAIYAIVRAGLICAVFWADFGLNGLIAVEVIGWGLLMLLLLYCYYSKFAWLNKPSGDAEFPTKRFVRYGKFAYFNEMGTSILNVSTDLFVISAFLGPVEVGIYAFANKVNHMFVRYMPHKAFKEVIRPAFMRKYAQSKDKNDLNRMFNLLIKFGAFFIFPFTVGVLALGDMMIIHVFGAKYLDSLVVLWIVSIFTSINVVMVSTGMVLQSIEKVEILLYSKVFAIYNLIADIAVVGIYGILGVAVVTGSAVIFKNIFCYHYAKKYAGIKIEWRRLGIILINSMFMGLILYVLKSHIQGIGSFVAIGIFGLIAYLMIAYVNKSFSEEERSFIQKILKMKIFVF